MALRLTSLLMFLLFAVSTSCAESEPPAGFISLFNGSDLTGWHGRPHFDPRRRSGQQLYSQKGRRTPHRWFLVHSLIRFPAYLIELASQVTQRRITSRLDQVAQPPAQRLQVVECVDVEPWVEIHQVDARLTRRGMCLMVHRVAAPVDRLDQPRLRPA